MDQEKRQNIALMRYSAIAPLVTGNSLEYSSLSAFYRHVSAKGIQGVDGEIKHYAPATIENWYLMYKKGGFDMLLPNGRSDLGMPRKLDEDIQEAIKYYKANYPRMSAASIYRQLLTDGKIRNSQVSESTICRYVNILAVQMQDSTREEFRRYERAHINEVWCGDSSVGTYVLCKDGKKRKFYIIALIDDASRFVVGAQVFFEDNFENLMCVIRSAVLKFGKPGMFNFDNGAAYKNKQMELLAARIGTTINYNPPYTPTGKAKIERWFRTLKDQWLSTVNLRDYSTLEEVQKNLNAYVQVYNTRVHSSLKGSTPQERFFSEPQRIKRIPENKIDEYFMLEIERRVSNDSVVSIECVEYEVDYRYAKQRIRIRYSPDMSRVYVVTPDDELVPIRILNKKDNSHVKREKIRLSDSGGES